MSRTYAYHTKASIDDFIAAYSREKLLNHPTIAEQCAPGSEAAKYLAELRKSNGHIPEDAVKAERIIKLEAENTPVVTTVSVTEPEPIKKRDDENDEMIETAAVEDQSVSTTASEASECDSTTEEELISYVQQWDEDIDYGLAPVSANEMMAKLKEVIRFRPPKVDIPTKRLAQIIKEYAPNAMKLKASSKSQAYPSELEPLVQTGQAFCEDECWFVKRCYQCGKFNLDECCGKPTARVVATSITGALTSFGKQAVGLEPIRPPHVTTLVETKEALTRAAWWSTFSGFDELEDGGLKMYIENFLPEGVAIISSLPKEGKTWLALSIVKALTTGRPLFGRRGFDVPEQVPVLYLQAEAGDRAFKHRMSKFKITNDKTKFLCRTLTKGMIGLQNPDLEAAVRVLKPVVILDVLSCFNESEDEDDSVQNQKLRGMISSLRAAGAPVIIVLHHTTKNFKDKPTKENAVRGSGDILAMVDVVWALMMDDRLPDGVKEVEVRGWGRDFEPVPTRLALTRKTGSKTLSTGFGAGVVSVIDETGDLAWVDKEAVREAAEKADQDFEDTLEQMVQNDPKIPLRKLAESVEQSYRRVRDTLEDLGWTRGKSKHATWTKDSN